MGELYLKSILISGIIFSLHPFVSCSAMVQVAKVSMSKIKGTVTFTQASLSGPTHINFNLDGITEELEVKIYTLPMRYEGGPARSCRPAAIGEVYNPTNLASTNCSLLNQTECAIGDLSGKIGNIAKASSKSNYTDLNLPLSGQYSIFSRTVVFMTTSGVAKACGLIDRSFGPGRTAVAQFKGPIAGTIYFRQVVENDPTLMYINLFYTDNSTSPSEYFLAVHENQVKSVFGPDQCSDVGKVFNPFSISDLSQCRKTNQAGCPVGELKSKNGYINVTGATSDLSSTQIAYTDSNLPVNGRRAIVGRSLVLYHRSHPSKPITCANISQVLRKEANVFFDADKDDGAFGWFTFKQASPFDPTTVAVHMFNMSKRAEGFHVHEYPNPDVHQVKGNKFACSGAVAGDHLNPFGVDAKTSPPNGAGTFDEYEVGDLSSKYGSFLNKDKQESVHEDLNLPLYGRYSIIGRSLVIHHPKKDGNKRWICNNIFLKQASGVSFNAQSLEELTRPCTKDVSLSLFTGPDIKGYIMLTQFKTDILYGAPFESQMYLNLSHINKEKSPNHNWHVHEKPVGDDMKKAIPDRCQSTAAHYNPYSAYVEGNYKATCSPTNPLRCELGDSSAKSAQYSLGSGPRFYTDVDTPLTGQYSVMDRSIVIHVQNGGADRQGCADIKRYVKDAHGNASQFTAILSHVVLAFVALMWLV